MAFLSPLALLWLGSVPLLIWLWRLSTTRRQVRIPSLVPFEHLAKRPPRRRTRLAVNRLFWLQLAALIALALTLAGPVWFQRGGHTFLVIVDTSASLGARHGRADVLAHAARRLLGRLARTHPADQVFLMASAPITALTEQPQRDRAVIQRAIGELRVSHLPGNLATAARIGRALLGGRVDRTILVTDEPAPPETGPDVEVLTVGGPLQNLAIVGLMTHGGFCSDEPARVVVTVENFSDQPASARVIAQQKGAEAAHAETSLPAGAQAQVSLTLPEGRDGWVDVRLEAERDALAVDNRASLFLHHAPTIPVAVVSNRAAFRDLVGRWLSACEGLMWTEGVPSSSPSASDDAWIVVTDGNVPSDPRIVGALQWQANPHTPQRHLMHWVVETDHPVGSYLSPVEQVATSTASQWLTVPFGEPVVWSLVEGERRPLVVAGESDGRKTVLAFMDPVGSAEPTPLLFLFFNSLRWLMESPDVVRTGEPLVVRDLSRGPVTVVRPDGTRERLHHEGGVFQYEATTHAGTYRIAQGAVERTWVANFLDPLESNLLKRHSTWQPMHEDSPAAAEPPRVRRPLATALLGLIVALLLVEWRLYSAKRT